MTILALLSIGRVIFDLVGLITIGRHSFLFINKTITLIFCFRLYYLFLLGTIDAIWWSVATVTTVGYGESIPKIVGKVIAVVLMFSGITTLGLLTNSLNNIFVRSGRQTERKLAEFEKELAEQRAILEEIRSTVLAMSRKMDKNDD